MDKILVVIPTFNEKENIERLIDSIVGIGENINALVVDDASPDGTSSIVKSHDKFGSRVFLIDRTGKNGRGSACIDGFKYAISEGIYSYVLEMDADFSHDPIAISEILEKAKNYEVVIGSRYIKGSKIVGWGLKRSLFSKFANIYARFFLRVPIHDYTNGYRCYKVEELKKLDFDSFKSSGYITLSELAYNLYKNGCKFAEIPITFVNRRRGTSNLSFKEIKEAFFLVPALRFKS